MRWLVNLLRKTRAAGQSVKILYGVFLRSPLAFVLDVLAKTDFSKLDCAPTLCFLQDGKV